MGGDPVDPAQDPRVVGVAAAVEYPDRPQPHSGGHPDHADVVVERADDARHVRAVPDLVSPAAWACGAVVPADDVEIGVGGVDPGVDHGDVHIHAPVTPVDVAVGADAPHPGRDDLRADAKAQRRAGPRQLRKAGRARPGRVGEPEAPVRLRRPRIGVLRQGGALGGGEVGREPVRRMGVDEVGGDPLLMELGGDIGAGLVDHDLVGAEGSRRKDRAAREGKYEEDKPACGACHAGGRIVAIR